MPFGDQCSSRKIIPSGEPGGFVLVLLLVLTYTSGLPNGLNYVCKAFADDTSILSKVFDKDKSQRNFNNDLSIISEWAFQWKLQFSTDPNKQTNYVYFYRKPNINDYILIKINDSPDQLCESEKQLGLILDIKLKFVTNSIALLDTYLSIFRENLCYLYISLSFNHTLIIVI